MEIKVLAFGIAKDILGDLEVTVDLPLPEDPKVDDLKEALFEAYPALEKLRSIAIAVNSQYTDGSEHFTATDEIALIPPVSGG